MHRAAMVLAFSAFSCLLHAQAADSFEIRGTVLELDSDGTASLTVKGAALPPLAKLKVSVAGAPAAVPDAEGKFVLAGLKFPAHRVRVDGLTRDHYLKELHINGARSPGDEVLLGSGTNQLEIVIDDKPGMISGTVGDGITPVGDAEVMLYPKVCIRRSFRWRACL